MEERRKFPRTEINEPGYVSSGGSVMHCMVLNISPEGCAIEVDEPAFVPQQFRLVMANDAAAVRGCQVAWIQGKRIGLAFVDLPQHADAKPRVAEPANPPPA
jgi:hypothetical protein